MHESWPPALAANGPVRPRISLEPRVLSCEAAVQPLLTKHGLLDRHVRVPKLLPEGHRLPERGLLVALPQRHRSGGRPRCGGGFWGRGASLWFGGLGLRRYGGRTAAVGLGRAGSAAFSGELRKHRLHGFGADSWRGGLRLLRLNCRHFCQQRCSIIEVDMADVGTQHLHNLFDLCIHGQFLQPLLDRVTECLALFFLVFPLVLLIIDSLVQCNDLCGVLGVKLFQPLLCCLLLPPRLLQLLAQLLQLLVHDREVPRHFAVLRQQLLPSNVYLQHGLFQKVHSHSQATHDGIREIGGLDALQAIAQFIRASVKQTAGGRIAQRPNRVPPRQARGLCIILLRLCGWGRGVLPVDGR
mmetsp:Transcript_21761/g.34524  ORF Transcript_21761/g.34524 Transcript_21761/m.34524 type:complete len:355 (-) Transcript_21761:1595-2659(-)